MKKNLIVESNSGDKKLQKTYGYLNPNASDEALEGFATMTTALTTNEYQGAYLVTKRNVDGTEPDIPGGGSVVYVTKPTPNLSIGGWSVADTVYSAPITYSGDGELSVNVGTINNGVLTVADEDGIFNGVITASAGTSYAATKLNFSYNTDEVEAAAKPVPNLVLGSWSAVDTVYSAPITYSGDGELSVNVGSISNGVLTVADEDGTFNGVITATAGQSFAATKLNFSYNTDEVEAAAKPVPNLVLGSWSAVDTVYSAPITYSGDGELSVNVGSISNGTLTVSDADGIFNGVITASAGESFAGVALNFNYDTDIVTVEGGGGSYSANALEYVLAGASFIWQEGNDFNFGQDILTQNTKDVDSYAYAYELNITHNGTLTKNATRLIDQAYNDTSSSFNYDQSFSNTFMQKFYKVDEHTCAINVYASLNFSSGAKFVDNLHIVHVPPDGSSPVPYSGTEKRIGHIIYIMNPDGYFPGLCEPRSAVSMPYVTESRYSPVFHTAVFSSQFASLDATVSSEQYNSASKFYIDNKSPASYEILKGKPPVISFNGENVTIAEGEQEIPQPITYLSGYDNSNETNQSAMACVYSGLPNDSISTYQISNSTGSSVNPWLTDNGGVLLGCFYNKSKSDTYIITYKPGNYTKANYLQNAFDVWGFVFDPATHNTATLIHSSKKLPDILDDIAIG